MGQRNPIWRGGLLSIGLAAPVVLRALASAAYADAADVTALVAADTYVAASPGFEDADAADVAWAAHVTWRGQRRGATLDYVQRESLIGGPARRELHELAYTDGTLAPMTFTLGRYRVPGGYWLFADGVQIGFALTDSVEVAVYGGARSFSNARTEQLLRTDPHVLPLVGAALTRKGDVQARVSYTLTRDRVEIPRGDGMVAESEQPEQFLDAELFALLGDRVQVTAGATMGTRYLVTYPSVAAELTDDPRLDTQYFGAQSVFGLADVRVSPEWRIAGGLTAHRTKLGQLTDTPAAQSITGSFLEASGRATWRRAKTWRLAMRTRARVWADARQAYRVYGQAQFRRGALDLQAAAGADVRVGADEPMYDNRTTFLGRASVGRKTESLELAGGVAAVSAIGDELAATPGDDTGSTRAPYTLEARSYAFGRGFWTHEAWFAGLDIEVDLYGNGARGLLQVGWAR